MPRGTYFIEQVAVTHRNTVITHLIYLKFAFAPVCIVSSGRLFVHEGNMTRFSCGFLRKFRNMFYIEQTATSELKKDGVNIGHQLFCLSQELLQKIQSSDFFISVRNIF